MSSECCDVIVAHSPPMFTAHNAQPELSVLYQNWLVISHKQQSPLAVRRYNNARSPDSPPPSREDRQAAEQTEETCRRPCLVVRADSDASLGSPSPSSSSSSSSSSSGSSSDENEPSSPTRRKKKVVFADDRGLSLTHVRLMNEPSNQPPKLMMAGPSYLQPKTAGGVAATAASSSQSALPAPAGVPGLGMSAARPAAADQAQWRLWFPQPASNYMDFRRRLDVDNVSLENVIVKPADRWIVGTVKVRNLSYDKEVYVRCTRDKWATHQDTVCAYVQNNAMVSASSSSSSDHHHHHHQHHHHQHQHHHHNGSGAAQGACGPAANVAAIYDTFSFRLPLPGDARALEFAVCYKSPDFECWDNNDGRNYCMSLQDASGQHPANNSINNKPPLSTSLSAPMLLQQTPAPQPPSAQPSSMSSHEFGAELGAAGGNKQPVHYFGAMSRHNSWGAFRDPQHKKSSSAYW